MFYINTLNCKVKKTNLSCQANTSLFWLSKLFWHIILFLVFHLRNSLFQVIILLESHHVLYYFAIVTHYYEFHFDFDLSCKISCCFDLIDSNILLFRLSNSLLLLIIIQDAILSFWLNWLFGYFKCYFVILT